MVNMTFRKVVFTVWSGERSGPARMHRRSNAGGILSTGCQGQTRDRGRPFDGLSASFGQKWPPVARVCKINHLGHRLRSSQLQFLRVASLFANSSLIWRTIGRSAVDTPGNTTIPLATILLCRSSTIYPSPDDRASLGRWSRSEQRRGTQDRAGWGDPAPPS